MAGAVPAPYRLLRAVFAREVVDALHFDETAAGARERGTQPLALVEPGGGRVRRHDEVDVAVVELVDQRDETPRLIVACRAHHRHPGENHRLVVARNLDVILLAARP